MRKAGQEVVARFNAGGAAAQVGVVRDRLHARDKQLLTKVRPTPQLNRNDHSRFQDPQGHVAVVSQRELCEHHQLLEVHRHIVTEPLKQRAFEHVEARDRVQARRGVHESPVGHAHVDDVLLRDGQRGHEVVVRGSEAGQGHPGARVLELLNGEHRAERDYGLGFGVEVAPAGAEDVRDKTQGWVREVIGVSLRVLVV